jgi:formylmethanofuran dehydrogenase subunit E
MHASEILSSDDFKRCETFHGHICPGLSIGYQAAKKGLDLLSEQRAQDEELVTIVETDACCVDAIQVLTGCTFGKGNLIYKDHGKMVFTFFSRNTGKGIRLAMRPGAFAPNEEHMTLLNKIMAEEATEEMRQRFNQLHYQRSCDVLEMSSEALFNITDVTVSLPAKAKIEPSELCCQCKEPTMASKLVLTAGEKKCRACAIKSL